MLLLLLLLTDDGRGRTATPFGYSSHGSLIVHAPVYVDGKKGISS